LLTLPQEVSLIWSARWNLIKVLFLLTRYLPFVDLGIVLHCECFLLVLFVGTDLTSVTDRFQQHPDAGTCYLLTATKASSWLFVVITSLAESQCLSVIICVSVVLIRYLPPVMLTVRTWAVWNRDRRLSIGLPIFFVLCWAPMIKIIDMFLKSTTRRHISLHRETQLTVNSHTLRVYHVTWVLDH
jgi:hypothetical protein